MCIVYLCSGYKEVSEIFESSETFWKQLKIIFDSRMLTSSTMTENCINCVIYLNRSADSIETSNDSNIQLLGECGVVFAVFFSRLLIYMESTVLLPREDVMQFVI